MLKHICILDTENNALMSTAYSSRRTIYQIYSGLYFRPWLTLLKRKTLIAAMYTWNMLSKFYSTKRFPIAEGRALRIESPCFPPLFTARVWPPQIFHPYFHSPFSSFSFYIPYFGCSNESGCNCQMHVSITHEDQEIVFHELRSTC